MPIDIRTKLNLVASDPNFAQTLTNAPEAEDEHLYKRLNQDYPRYLEMRRDPHVRSVLNKRRQAILGRRMIVEPVIKKVRDLGVKAAEDILKLINYESICSALLNSGQLIGFSVLQMDWDQREGFILPTTKFIPQNRFMFAYPELDKLDIPTATGETLDPETEIIMVGGYELRLLTKDHPIYGERCPKGRFLVYTFDADNTPWGLGLGYSIYPWWSIKREAMKSWLLHSDRYGSPPTIGTHPSDVSENDPEMQGIISRFERFLKSVSPNGWARLPEDFKLTLPEGASADPGVHERLIATADAQVSKAVLGEMQYSDKNSGSYAANVSQVEDRDANLTDADCNILDEHLATGLWSKIAELNYPNVKRPPIVRRETIADQREQEQQQKKKAELVTQAQADQTLMTFLVPSEKYIKETYGDDWTLKQPEPAPPPQPQPAEVNMREFEFADVSRHVYWKDFEIAIEQEVGEKRFGRPLKIAYGYIFNLVGADNEPLDVYLGPFLSSDRVFRVTQLDQNGKFDEHKFMLFFDSEESAARAYKVQMPYWMFGGIEEIPAWELEQYRKPKDAPAAVVTGGSAPTPPSYAEPVVVEGKVLTDEEWDSLSVIDEVAIADALRTMAKVEPVSPTFDEQPRDNWGRFAKKNATAVHAVEHLAENIGAWKAGKVVGGAIAGIAAQHGVNPEVAQLFSETAVQALSATLLHLRKNKEATGTDIAAKFISEAGAAFVGKVAHTGMEPVIESLGGSENVKRIASIVAGKVSGLATNTTLTRTGAAAVVAIALSKQGGRVKALLGKSDFRKIEFADNADSGNTIRIANLDRDALFDLVVAAYCVAVLVPEENGQA